MRFDFDSLAMADLTNLSSKLVRAFWFYLIKSGVVDISRCYHAFDYRERKFNGMPIVDVKMMPVGPTALFTGDDDYVVEIQVKAQFVNQPDQSNSDAQRIPFDALVGKIRQLIMLSDDGGVSLKPARDAINALAWTMPVDASNGADADQVRFSDNHADMADFTIQKLISDVNGVANAADCNMAVVQRFKVTACEMRIDGLQ